MQKIKQSENNNQNELRGIEKLDTKIGLLLKKFAEKSRDVVWARSSDYKEQLFISPSFDEIWGVDRQVIYDNPSPEKWLSYIHPDDVDYVVHAVSKRKPNVSQDTSFLLEFRILRPDGQTRWIRDESFPLFNSQDELVGFAGISQDITKTKEIEEAEVSAKVANKTKSEFLANMSHDLRTPLNWLLGAADILNKRNDEPEKAKLFEMLIDGGNRILQMVEEILDYSKLESGNLPLCEQPLNLLHCFENVVQMMAIEADKKNLPLILDFPQTVTRHVITDIQRIRRVLMNLISNALKFTDTGMVKIQVQELKKDQKQVVLMIMIEDTGIGIKANKINSIFDRYSRLEDLQKSATKGVGLGLAIVKNFIEAMNGTIEVTSNLNEVTVFRCIIPFKIDQQLLHKPSLFIKRFSKIPILLIDDLIPRAQAHKQYLMSDSIIVTSSHNALEKFQQGFRNNHFSIILIDEQTKAYPASELARSIRSLAKKQQPLMVLCKTKKQISCSSQQLIDFHAVIEKPLLPSKLPKQLSQAFTKHVSKDENELTSVKNFQANILLVEDEPFGQKIITMLLEEELNCTVDIAQNAQQGFKLAISNEYDLILMDIGLPDESGLSLTRRIRRIEQSGETTPIVALTAHASDDMITQCRQAGMNNHLAKPASVEELLHVINKAIHGQINAADKMIYSLSERAMFS